MSKKYVTREFTLGFLEELDLPYNLEDQVYEDSHRWCDSWSGVAEIDGEHWKFYFYKPSTEYQEGQGEPWGYGDYPDTVEAFKVEKVLVTMEQWQQVESPDKEEARV